jgi:hypothetical protein
MRGEYRFGGVGRWPFVKEAAYCALAASRAAVTVISISIDGYASRKTGDGVDDVQRLYLYTSQARFAIYPAYGDIAGIQD